MNHEFWNGFQNGIWAIIVVIALLYWILPQPKSRVFVVKYCVEKQVKEACEILGDAYGK